MKITVLRDYQKNSDKARPWLEKKKNSLEVSKSYKRLNLLKRYYKMRECGSYLEFKRFLIDNSMKLNRANFCKVRLCPLCAWRRSLKVFGQVSQIMDKIQANDKYDFLFLTLTIKNCKGPDLGPTIDILMKGYDKLFKRRKIANVIKGSFRALEITHNSNPYSKSYNTYHPHFHLILVVNKSYFTARDYINITQWRNYWQECIDVDYQPMLDIRRINNTQNNISKSIAEVAKYTIKDSDILHKDLSLQDEIVSTLDEVLYGRRLVSFRGIFFQIRKQLKLDDVVEGDLVHTNIDDMELNVDLEYIIERYQWNIGFSDYKLIDIVRSREEN